MTRIGRLRLSRPTMGLICLVAVAGLSFSLTVLASEKVARLGQTGENGQEDVDLPCLGAEIRIQARPSNIRWGESSQLSWSVELPEGCAGPKIRLAGEEVGLVGTRTVAPSITKDFVLMVSETRLGVPGQTFESAHIDVSYPEHVVINRSTRDPVDVLRGALAAPNPLRNGQVVPITVELCDVELDLTDHSIEIGSDRSLIASPGCERGPLQLGPRLYIRKPRPADRPLLQIRGDNVLIAGFRMQGPTDAMGAGDVREAAIRVWPSPNPQPIRSIEISNMEIYYWSGMAIAIDDEQGSSERGRLLNSNHNAVRIRSNYLHNNRHASGFGYGVTIGNGGFAFMERNVFDENRHAISGGGPDHEKHDYSGYIARDNLILSGGGDHCSEHWAWGLTGWTNLWPRCWQTHQIDMHGDQNAWYSDSNWACGTAGETVIIERNTILYTAGSAIKIRGNPLDKAVVDRNVFANSDRSDAITQNGACGSGDNISKPIDVRPTNMFGANPMSQLGSCDFSGDGQQDQFMATGVTWWARSPVTKQWRYMNTKTEVLSQLELADVDRDGRCDVALKPATGAPIRQYSQGGTSDWQPAPN